MLPVKAFKETAPKICLVIIKGKVVFTVASKVNRDRRHQELLDREPQSRA